MAQEEKVLQIVKKVLKGHRFALIGANAANLWVHESKIRATHDLDFFVEANEDAFVHIAKNFRDEGFNAHIKFGQKKDPVPLIVHLTSDEMPPVDLLVASKKWEISLLDNAVPIQNYDIKVGDPKYLILSKLYSASEIDLIDIKNLVLFPVYELEIEKIRALIIQFFNNEKLDLFNRAIESK